MKNHLYSYKIIKHDVNVYQLHNGNLIQTGRQDAQLNILIERSKDKIRTGALRIPIYCFYNFIHGDETFAWTFCFAENF